VNELKLKKKEYVQNKIRNLKKIHSFLEIIIFGRNKIKKRKLEE